VKSFKPTWPFIAIALFVAAMVLEIGWVGHHRARATRALSRLEAVKQEHRMLVRGSPAPRADTEAAMAAARSGSERLLHGMRQELGLTEENAESSDLGTPMDEYFALGDFAARMRARIGAAAIDVGRTERFGFSAYANAGPEPEILAEVRRQRETVELLVEILAEARPARFLGIKRTEPGRNGVTRGPSLSEDCFSVPRNRSLATADVVDADAFRLEFTGQTGALRRLLNSLAQAARPVIVRAVEVEPTVKDAHRREVTKTSSTDPVDPTVKRFSVLVEVPRPAITGDSIER
jgi:hypothetical protein